MSTIRSESTKQPRRIRRLTAGLATGLAALTLSACGIAPVTAFTSITAPSGGSESGVAWFAGPTADGHEVRVAVARAEGSGVHPTIVILPGSDGLRRDYVKLAQQFAAQGFDAVTGCWFRLPQIAPTDTTAIACPNAPAFTGVSEASVSAVDAIVDTAKRATGADDAHIGILGYSRGGGAALLHAARTGARYPIVDVSGMVTAQVNSLDGHGPLPTDVNVVSTAGNIAAASLLFHGTADGIVVPDQSRMMRDALVAAGRTTALTPLNGICDGPCNHDVFAHVQSRSKIIADSSAWLHGRLG